MSTLPRRTDNPYGETMFLRPRDPDDHRQFKMLLPRVTPVFIYADENGRDWVRLEIPREVADSMGFGSMRCACCGDSEVQGNEHAVQLDCAWDEVSFFFQR